MLDLHFSYLALPPCLVLDVTKPVLGGESVVGGLPFGFLLVVTNIPRKDLWLLATAGTRFPAS
jgi:hypothetical protein